MKQDRLDLLAALAVVAQERSFTRAALHLGVSQSSLSRGIAELERRLKVRLLSRTTRSVQPTDACEVLLRHVAPALDAIDQGFATVGAMGVEPAGSLRLTATKNAAVAVLLPVLPDFCARHPQVKLEFVVDDTLVDIVAQRFDAGIRLGDIIEKDMIAVPVGPPMRFAVVASLDYLSDHPAPGDPQELSAHRCINYRMANGGILPWEFERGEKDFQVRTDGNLVFNDADLLVPAAVQGHGLAYVYEDDAHDAIRSGSLVRLLEDWLPPSPGYHLYHPSRRQTPPALVALVAALQRRMRMARA